MINVRVIKSEAEYDEAIGLITSLLSQDLDTDSEEFRLLEVLSILIEKFESENTDLGTADPIEAIKLRMDQQNLSNRDLVAYIGSIGKVSEVLNRKRPLSLNMIRALHKGLGIPYSSLMEDTQEAEEDLGIDWSQFPLKEMVSRGLIASKSPSELKSYAEEHIRKFFGSRLNSMTPALLRSSVRSGRQMNKYSLSVWHVLSLKKAEHQNSSIKFDPSLLDDGFFENLIGLSFLDDGPTLAVEYLGKFGIRLVVNKHFNKIYLDGAALLLENKTPVIAMTLRHDRLDNFWFVLMHELAHIKLHLYETDGGAIYDDLDSGAMDDIEQEADNFAMDWLVPEEVKEEIRFCTTAREVVKSAKKHNRSPAILAGFLRKERNNYRIFNQLIGRGEVRDQFNWNI